METVARIGDRGRAVGNEEDLQKGLGIAGQGTWRRRQARPGAFSG